MTKLQHYNILLVEDEALLLQSLIRNINALYAGFRVAFQAADGRKALQVLKNKNVHLVITDIRMPVMDGLALSKLIHEQYPSIFTIVLTGYADFSYAREALKQGVFDYLLKPVTPETLSDALGRVRVQLQKYYELYEDAGLAKRGAEEIIDYAVLYMREHYMDEIDLGQLASEIGFTSAYLTKLFNRFKGETPLKYLTDIRIHEAKRLLLDTTLTISQVGMSVGYPDQFHFSKIFRKYTGQNPTSYRKQNREGGREQD